MIHYLFGFSGRINRAKMWLFLLICVVYVIAAVCVVLGTVGFQHIADVAQGKQQVDILFGNPALGPVFGVLGLVDLAVLWVTLAVTTKRLHDRDKSAWWLLVFIALPVILSAAGAVTMLAQIQQHGVAHAAANPVPTLLRGVAFLIQIWAFIELYVFRGTEGENRYGPDPLA